jgi:hypothetical protein
MSALQMRGGRRRSVAAPIAARRPITRGLGAPARQRNAFDAQAGNVTVWGSVNSRRPSRPSSRPMPL